jgi:hypothetical protein
VKLATADRPPLGERLPPEVSALFFGPSHDDSPFATYGDLERAWKRVRKRLEAPYTSWWAFWRVDEGLTAEEADARAVAARTARVTASTGTSWAEQQKSGSWMVFWFTERGANDE